ncbi:MAG: methylated-DNA--[protein]-cysteine S-methyltransferase [Burkholderiaceae bacterium]|nr:MAG: methylated-DNA--[protein]-cysteine S-methyltransferase [Burkholderiaceae bacterium]TBR72881.1 MAG: methylated-DNA--[protein]-cysteine S-methyltransferase [Burkholderiaceae bacterium]
MKFDTQTVQTTFNSPLGPVIVAATDRGVAGVWFEGQRHLPDRSAWRVDDRHPVLVRAVRQLGEYFAGRRTAFDLPLDLHGGTAFQQSVWQALLRIPRGTTTSYGALSSGIGKPAAVRAVGAAVGRNPIGVIVPCHRVIGSDGSLTGYAGGLDRKAALLELEAALPGNPA